PGSLYLRCILIENENMGCRHGDSGPRWETVPGGSRVGGWVYHDGEIGAKMEIRGLTKEGAFMASRLLFVLTGTLLLAGSAARAETWKLDASHSAAQFSVRHMGISTVRGAFTKVTGTVEY